MAARKTRPTRDELTVPLSTFGADPPVLSPAFRVCRNPACREGIYVLTEDIVKKATIACPKCGTEHQVFLRVELRQDPGGPERRSIEKKS